MNKKLVELQEEKDKYTIIVGDFNCSLSVTDCNKQEEIQ